jgi:predicted AlkP superfamily pyrophosphatase or phosphodiesterase
MLTQVRKSESAREGRNKKQRVDAPMLDCARKLGTKPMSPGKSIYFVTAQKRIAATVVLLMISSVAWAQTPKPRSGVARTAAHATRPKLVVMIVVDQMRADYVDKFRGQWSGGLKRLVNEGAWIRTAAYTYAATETCPGHSTISTGAFPMHHGMVANAWWDRDEQKMVTCTSDPKLTNIAYAGGTTKGGDSAWRMLLPAYAEELKFQSEGATRVVTFSLKARAALTMAGHKADATTWFDISTGSWVTSAPYGPKPFIDAYVKQHPVSVDYGKTWSLSLPRSQYWYSEKPESASSVTGWSDTFPFPLRGKDGSAAPDESFYQQWATSPFADSYLTKLAENAVDSLNLGRTDGVDFLGISYSSTDYVGHTFGPRSWEIQDMLVRLDKDLGELFVHLDQKVGRGNYVVALSADHGVAPIPTEMHESGFDAGVLNMTELQDRMEQVLEPFNVGKTAIAKIAGNEVYFSQEIYDRLRHEPSAMKALLDATLTMPGVAEVFRAEELGGGFKTVSQTRTAAELSYFAGRSGDMYVLQQPYWLTDSGKESKHHTGTGHGTPYYYDQRVPILLMGFGIQHGEYFEPATPADIAPTLGALTGVTLATHDGRVLAEALQKRSVQ